MNAVHRRTQGAARLMGTALLAVTSSLLGACASSGTRVSADQVAKFKPGVTTEAEVIAALGQPNTTMTRPDGGKTDIYSHAAVSMKATSFIPVVGLFSGGSESSIESVSFLFDPNGILKSVSGMSSNNETNSGLLNQK